MVRSHHAMKAAALAGAVALVLTACGNSGSSDDETPGAAATTKDAGSGGDTSGALTIGTLLPQTGSLAFLGPPEIAGVDLAVKEINENGGINGKDVVVKHADSSDADHADVAPQS